MLSGNGETRAQPRSKMTMKKQHAKLSLKDLEDLGTRTGPYQPMALAVLNRVAVMDPKPTALSLREMAIIIGGEHDDINDAEWLTSNFPSELTSEL
jgi:hypothetical protein